MSDTAAREVRVGDSTVLIARFRGLKAILASALVARVMREMPQIQERVTEFRKEYRKKNTIIITPAMANMSQFIGLGLTREDFSQGPVELPEEPNGQAIMINMFPSLLDLARKEVVRFIALLAIPNSALEEADDADQVEAALDTYGKRLFREGDIDELLELLVIGWEVLQEQIEAKRDKLGKLQDLPFLRMLQSTQEEETTNETPPTSSDDVPISSDSEPPDTDGVEEQLSMASPGMS